MPISRSRRGRLRTRVLLGVLAVTLVALAAFDLAAVGALRGYLLSKADSQLRSVLSLYRPLAVPLTPPARTPQVSQVLPRQLSKMHIPAPRRVVIIGPRLRLVSPVDEYYVVFLPIHGSPRVFFTGNPDLRPRLPGWLHAVAVDNRALTVRSLNGRAQLRLRAVPEAGGTLVATASLAQVNRTVGRLQLIIILGSLAAGLLVAVGVAWVMRRGLRPIETMAAQADRITAGDLTYRVSPDDAVSEVGRLGAALNGMLARIEASMAEREASQEASRQFFADASHELRNPLASLRANAELYQQGALRDRAQVDEAMRRITLEAQRMSGLVDDMLRLARLDQHPEQRRDLVDLTGLVDDCAERAMIASPRRYLGTCVAPGLRATGDEELLRRAIDNLLANVRAHTPEDASATISAGTDGTTVTVEVSDGGHGVPADQLPRIFGRFYRAPAPSQHPGSGLGLAIIAAIATAHSGTVKATGNSPHGLRISLTVPASGQSGMGSYGDGESHGATCPGRRRASDGRADGGSSAGA